jgi:hypothetical protein
MEENVGGGASFADPPSITKGKKDRKNMNKKEKLLPFSTNDH